MRRERSKGETGESVGREGEIQSETREKMVR
jgi:hypothetical protein